MQVKGFPIIDLESYNAVLRKESGALSPGRIMPTRDDSRLQPTSGSRASGGGCDHGGAGGLSGYAEAGNNPKQPGGSRHPDMRQRCRRLHRCK